MVQRTLHRRRVLLATLLVASAVSLVVAFAARQGQIWGVHAVADVLLVIYLGVLLHVRNTAAAQDMTRRGLRT